MFSVSDVPNEEGYCTTCKWVSVETDPDDLWCTQFEDYENPAPDDLNGMDDVCPYWST